MATFDIKSLREQIENFADKVPQILRRSNLTIDLADEVDRHMSVAAMEKLFTMAVVGRFRTGKSTLINALVGEDLAMTGVTETTATVNWLRSGTAEQARRFGVVWDDRSREERDLSERDKWIGDSELAMRTRYLEFFSTAEFLKLVQIVDTPGTGSVLAPHTEKARGFALAERRNERDTLDYGGDADCFVYVIPPVVRQTDDDFLAEFASKTRLANTSPYNSVAVMHKWETLEHPEPWVEAQNMAQRAFEKLQKFVAAVIPVSGPLAWAHRHCSSRFWDQVVELAKATPFETLQYLVDDPRQFDCKERESCPFDAAKRRALRTEPGVNWPWLSFKTVLMVARQECISNGATLKAAVGDMSGIDQLMCFLDKRFFNRSRLIQASNLLNKALRATNKARNRFRECMAQLEERSARAREALAELAGLVDRIPKARGFINDALSEADRESLNVKSLLRELETETRTTCADCSDFERDLAAMQILDDQPDEFGIEESIEILHVLGAYGCGIVERLEHTMTAGDDLLRATELRLAAWLERCELAAGHRRRVLNQVVFRLEAMLQVLAKQSENKT